MPLPSYQVYALRNLAGRFCIGMSADVSVRLQQHNLGISLWTRGRGPWALAWVSAPRELGAARRLENQLKRQKGGAGFYRLTGLPRASGS